MACQTKNKESAVKPDGPYILVLGTIQDAGSPHINCMKDCCKALHTQSDPDRKVVSLGVVDPSNNSKYLFEATPDITEQLRALSNESGLNNTDVPDACFISHAHIGHYTGLQYFGREAMGADNVPVYLMPRMDTFIRSNGPWSQLVDLENISIQSLTSDSTISLGNIQVTPFLVPHRDEFSETVGFKIKGPAKTVVFIPDIDKWQKWERSIVSIVKDVDYAFLDGTFYDNSEIPDRDISEIPHPFVIETMALFDSMPDAEKKKIHFIHFNHTNPLLNKRNSSVQTVTNKGYSISFYRQRVQI